MSKKAYWWEYTREYIFGNRENVPTKKSLLNFFRENDIIGQQIKDLEKRDLEVVGICIIETFSALKIGFYVRKKSI